MTTNAQAALIAASNLVREEYVTEEAAKFKKWLDKQDKKDIEAQDKAEDDLI